MKKFLSFLAIIGIILASNCSRIPENNDPVIGIWSKVEVKNTSSTNKATVRQEWIFNDAYLGRYHRYESKNLTLKTDFSWKVEKDTYTISYPGTDKPDDIVKMETSTEIEFLKENTGEVLAIRE
ncbi:hypothetical protein [Costertonia aggregata]|uniref:Lipocalin family protein n=1 Tax=Costertonia aggregata TaxID=343403 RepID=A0A7H9ARZ7_9FLAO|nr:hypothetical protein [Costertonia aggregata]QLG46177.1 hypothetical protein HYG79_12740 [Costertonia aggregata]